MATALSGCAGLLVFLSPVRMLRRCGQLGRRHASSSRVHERRGPYAVLNDADVATFERLLGPSAVLTDPADTEAFNVDWLRICRGECLFPIGFHLWFHHAKLG
ncbi:hypothetical protein HPB49_026171 [Dermacentor silvarum]|nr:hypothetical protein HPB49_026171 [Dermacentor silvarum]